MQNLRLRNPRFGKIWRQHLNFKHPQRSLSEIGSVYRKTTTSLPAYFLNPQHHRTHKKESIHAFCR